MTNVCFSDQRRQRIDSNRIKAILAPSASKTLSHFVEHRPPPWAEHTFDDLEPIKARRRTTELVSYRPLPNGFEESGFRAGILLGGLLSVRFHPKRTFGWPEICRFERPLSARSGHLSNCNSRFVSMGNGWRPQQCMGLC